jgi:hypothetical protein
MISPWFPQRPLKSPMRGLPLDMLKVVTVTGSKSKKPVTSIVIVPHNMTDERIRELFLDVVGPDGTPGDEDVEIEIKEAPSGAEPELSLKNARALVFPCLLSPSSSRPIPREQRNAG